MANPQIETIRKHLAENPALPEGASVEQIRAAMDAMGEGFPKAKDVSLMEAEAADVPAAWFEAPGVDQNRVLVYLHGGGYLSGSLLSHGGLMGELSRTSGARVLGLSYRLAPEHPFPAALEDTVAAYRWLLGQGTLASSMAIVGDSAGGALAVAALVSLRDAGDALPGCAVSISPWADMEGKGESLTARAARDPMVAPESIPQLAEAYLQGQDPQSPLASPIHADLRGLPPLLVQVGTEEILYDDAVRLADKARRDGVDVTFEPWDEMLHVWHLFTPMLRKGQEGIDRVGGFVRKHTG